MPKKSKKAQTAKVVVYLEPSDASRLKRLSEQAVTTLAPNIENDDMPSEEKAALKLHLESMARVTKAIKTGQRDYANDLL